MTTFRKGSIIGEVPKLEEALEDGGRLPPLLLTAGGG